MPLKVLVKITSPMRHHIGTLIKTPVKFLLEIEIANLTGGWPLTNLILRGHQIDTGGVGM
ncbi:MAG: hypothetical protein HQK57_15225 [Deltaproteobacteria bacterium]|nr:hypothetical protein [Deltaproteobacteria bacterium]